MSQKTERGGTDWGNAVLRKAAVEYVLQKLGEWPRGAEAQISYVAKLSPLMKAMDGPVVSEMMKWLKDPALLPAWSDRPGLQTRHRVDNTGGLCAAQVEDCSNDRWFYGRVTMDDIVSEKAADALHVPAGALPDAMEDPLSRLLREEDGVLSEEERGELATALESGVDLGTAERLALACLLRGSDLAGRRETVRAVIDWVVPPEGEVTDIWTVGETIVTVPAGSVWRYEDCQPVIPGRGMLGSSRLVVESAEGVLVMARLFMRVKSTEVAADGRLLLKVRRLVPERRFAKDHVLMQFALLASMVRQDGRNGKEWGQLFGVKSGKALVSYHKKNLVEKLQRDTGSKVGVRGLRHKADPRKGKTKGGGE